MLKAQVNQSESGRALALQFHKSFVPGHGSAMLLPQGPAAPALGQKQKKYWSVKAVSKEIKAKAVAAGPALAESVRVKAVVTVQLTCGGVFSDNWWERRLDDFTDLLHKTLLLELVSSDLDPLTGMEKETITGYARWVGKEENELKYETEIVVPEGFGEVGAVLVENEHHAEMYLKTIVLGGFPNGPLNIACNSFVHSKFDNKEKRVFFTNKSYLQFATPGGLKRLRERELEILRGDGKEERKKYERIYDYDTYNDLGDPDNNTADLARPVLGGRHHPYPRRCRTGRPHCNNDPTSEKKSGSMYVPRDEAFSDVKNWDFNAKKYKSAAHGLVPYLQTKLLNPELGFPYFTKIDSLFNEGLTLPKPKNQSWVLNLLLPRLVKALNDAGDELLLFEVPETINRDKFSWFRDEEFSRQTLAGLNPFSLQLVTEWPLKSKLDPETYGPAESAITAELVEREIKGVMTVDEAIERKKLFMLEYHDLLLPYVHKVREIKGTTLYGSRTLFMLTHDGTLRPLAIELTRPPKDDKPMWREVFTPGWDATGCWLWRLAKAHVCAHDAGVHQLIVHWLRTHCCTEPYIIAANRQLSAMHPIYRLLLPHFRYTMEINALARMSLINAGGIIESTFFPGKYSMELSSVYYDKYWRFDMEALPADLIRRGMAVEDPTAEHGLRLTIEDYPFANDGLILWDALKQWVSDYVNHYYPKGSFVESDEELQAWWNEVRTKGHADKKDEPWWPTLKTQDDLTQVVTTIIWVTSGHHAAVNFGQYHYAGYFPNRPSIARTNMPTEEPLEEEEFKNFLAKPEFALLKCFPSQIQAATVMAILDVLSNHSVDEEYLGGEIEPAWSENPVIKAAFERFNGRLMELEGIIDARNLDLNLKNRSGAGVVPYELLKPHSEAGVTGMGVPYSISI
ncbi:linoleate 13S-lipoxygenase 2-1, chloroplastic-like [Macadamia integrifolia]|uniref:linoleate 13S-lipoxygenase 2-1, chloroplastic-like n=1 Tax=Macadamia integrifolia TaxID=60698 RepID=UPI001C532E15|nr:linoleate 13S-lipoxygenase 2-1, chloroplastic-like [Macadamia integrifolia]